MSRLPLALLLAVPLLAVAAPVPESVTHSKQFKKTFGTSHSPADGCSFHFDGTTLTAKLSDDWIGYHETPLDGLRTGRTASGDFELTVTVRTTAPAEPPKGAGRGAKRCDLGGGLVVWEPDAKAPGQAGTDKEGREKVVSVGRYYTDVVHGCWTRGDSATFPMVVTDRHTDEANPAEVVYLRLTRTGKDFATAVSADGEKWEPLLGRAVEMADTVSVGVWAFNATGQKYDVIFEKFTLTPLK